ncbi:MAG: tetratricopeptide repeat protein [Robiginitomaculum sp.]|nr:tetratricopeptide repeat protein [Robiginitomaculum sp.]
MFNLRILLSALVLSVANASAVWADLRDVSFAAQAETASILFSFAGQPSAVKVFITETGMDVDVLGVEGTPIELISSAASLFRSIRQIPAPGGVRIRFALSKNPIGAKAQVYQNSILVTAVFLEPIDGAKDALLFVSKKPKMQNQMTKKPAPEQMADAKQVADAIAELDKMAKPDDMAAPLPDPAMEKELSQPTNDGDVPTKRIPLPDTMVGQGMIREASLRVAGSLSKEQCAASEQAVTDDPWALENLARFGACLSREGKAKDAREVFERLLTFDPDTFAAYVGLGAIAQDAGEAKQARNFYEQALSLGGTDAEAAQARDLLRSLDAQ